MPLLIQIVERGQRLIWHVPLAKNLVDHPGRKSRRNQPSHHPRSFFLVFRLADALALQVLARQGFLVGLAVAGVQGFGDERGSYALLLQILADAALAQLFVLLAQAGVGFGEGRIVQVAVLAEADEDGRNGGLAPLAGFDAGLHQAAEFGFRAHLPA